MTKDNLLAKAMRIADSLIIRNTLTGQGSQTDPTGTIRIAPGAPIPFATQSALFSGSAIARNIVTKLPEAALSKGFEVNIPDQELQTTLTMMLDQHDAVNKIRLASIYARAFGGAGIVINTDSDTDPALPISPGNIGNIKSLEVFHAHQLKIVQYNSDRTSESYGEPTIINVQRETLFDSEIVPTHTSRMILFPGLDTTIDERKKRQGWDLCVYDLLQEVLNQYNTVFFAASDALYRANQAVYKIKNLADILSGESEDMIMARYSIMDRLRSSFRAITIGEDEEYQIYSQQVQGIADLLDKYTLQLAQAANIPLVILTGQSPGGLSATGESDLRMWNSNVESYYEQYLKKKIEDLCAMYMLSWNVSEPEKWSVTIPSVWNLTPEEETQQRKTTVETDVQLINAGVYTPEEVALFRSLEGGWEKDIELTEEGRIARESALQKLYAGFNQSLPEPEETPTEELPGA